MPYCPEPVSCKRKTFVATYEKTNLEIQESSLKLLQSLFCHISKEQRLDLGNRGLIEILLDIIKSKLPQG